LWGTLIYHDTETNLFTRLGRLTGIKDEDVLEYLERNWLVRNDLTLEALATDICGYFHLNPDHLENIIDIWNEDMSNVRCYSDADEVLKSLRNLCKLAILSNTGPMTGRILKNLGFNDYFDFILFSCDAGLLKPDARIYEMTLAGLRTEAKYSYMVGDNPYSDLKTPKQMGMKTIFVDRYRNGKNYDFVDYTVSRLSSLLGILEI